MEIYLKISKLLLAHKTQNISAQETEELLAWRQEKTENEELFQKISQADGFEQFRQQYEEYDFTPKFLLLEQKIKQEKRKRIIKRLSYAAILLPFIFAIWEIIQFQNQGTTPTDLFIHRMEKWEIYFHQRTIREYHENLGTLV